MASLANVLRPGGLAIFIEIDAAMDNPSTKTAELMEYTRRANEKFGVSTTTGSSLEGWLRSGGLWKDIDVERIPLPVGHWPEGTLPIMYVVWPE